MAPSYAAVPEEAFRRRAEISSGAFDLYELYCKHRNRATGRCDPSIGYLASELHRTYKYVSDLKSELVARGWITRLGRRAVDLQVGFRPPKVVDIRSANSGKNPELGEVSRGRSPEKIRTSSPEISGLEATSPYSEHLNQPDDDDNASSSAEILEFYERLVGNEARSSDRRVAATLSHHPLHQVKIGIVLSLLRARSRINSLNYCVGAVEEAVETNATEDYLRYIEGHLVRQRRQAQPSLPHVGADLAEGDFGDRTEVDGARRAGGEGV